MKKWSPAELRILEINKRLSPFKLRVALNRAGYTRTEAAVTEKLRSMQRELLDGDGKLALPEHIDHFMPHMVMEVPSSPMLQVWHHTHHSIRLTLSREHDAQHFEQVWETGLRPGCKFSSYHMLRAVLAP